MRSKWFQRFTQISTSMLALTVLSPAVGTAQDTRPIEDADDTASTEKELFTLFPDLDTAKTKERLAQLRKDPKLAKQLALLTDALAKPSTKAKDIEGDVLALIKGEKYEAAELTLNAVMRDYYDHYVVGSTDKKSLTAVAVSLEQTDNTLTDAAYGTSPQSRRIQTARLTRR